MFSRSVLVLGVALLSAAVATDVQQCEGRSDENLTSRVQLDPCKKLPCRLKKGTNEHITILFTPDSDIKEIKNSVSAKVLGIDLPFVGVDGKSICDKIFLSNGDKASCPLKAGTEYMYKDSFAIHSFYPLLKVDVRWALQKTDETSLVCFKVPAKIVN